MRNMFTLKNSDEGTSLHLTLNIRSKTWDAKIATVKNEAHREGRREETSFIITVIIILHPRTSNLLVLGWTISTTFFRSFVSVNIKFARVKLQRVWLRFAIISFSCVVSGEGGQLIFNLVFKSSLLPITFLILFILIPTFPYQPLPQLNSSSPSIFQSFSSSEDFSSGGPLIFGACGLGRCLSAQTYGFRDVSCFCCWFACNSILPLSTVADDESSSLKVTSFFFLDLPLMLENYKKFTETKLSVVWHHVPFYLNLCLMHTNKRIAQNFCTHISALWKFVWDKIRIICWKSTVCIILCEFTLFQLHLPPLPYLITDFFVGLDLCIWNCKKK